MRIWGLGALLLLSLAGPAFAETASSDAAAAIAAATKNADASSGTQAAVSLDRHFTTNALDSDLAFSDFYRELRGSLFHTFKQSNGYIRLGGAFRATSYDRIRIEDDRSLILLAEAYRHLTDRIELRGTLTWRLASIGDDLRIGDLAIGTRTRSNDFGGALQAGIDLGGGNALILEAGDTVERYGKARFQDDLIRPAKIEPDRNRLALGATWRHTDGRLRYGVAVSAAFVNTEKLGDPPIAYSLANYVLRGEIHYETAGGTAIEASLGVAMLKGAHGIYEETRPAYSLLVKQPLKGGIELRGSLTGSYDLLDGDDPLAGWRQRLEFEANFPLGEAVAFGIGVFHQREDNLFLGNTERSNGVYLEFDYAVRKDTTLVARADFSECRTSVVDTRKKTLDTFLGFRTKL
ncbi:MAG: hypothetical protein EPN45_06495 [Rhizobiaceae bacterium]|nr:MAG: hypothetical protein EPN45_06495 [Rhizobiaceae bacterium]